MIDTHHHFWDYDPVRYGWIGPGMEVLQRDFGPADLQQTIDGLGISGVVSVQAEQSLGETARLLHHAAASPMIQGVVGWAPLADRAITDVLPSLAEEPKLKGLRHIVQDEPDPDYILRPDFNEGITALRSYNLIYDVLIFERHLPQTITFVDHHPDQTFVLDHLGKPKIGLVFREEWAKNLRELALRPNVFCKLSGLVTEAEQFEWTQLQLEPYLNTALECFGPERLMWGSDWPVCLLAATYRQWLELFQGWLQGLSHAEQNAIAEGTAKRVYRLEEGV